MLNKAISPKAGMSLVEVMMSLFIATLIILGSTSSVIVFAKIANAHENQSDFHRDVRNGFEQIAFDTRNSTGVAARSNTGFVFTFDGPSNVVYSYIADDNQVTRTENGSVTTVFRNVAVFDVLINSSDANSTLTFDEDELSIESIEFERHNGAAKASKLSITDFTFKIRNS